MKTFRIIKKVLSWLVSAPEVPEVDDINIVERPLPPPPDPPLLTLLFNLVQMTGLKEVPGKDSNPELVSMFEKWGITWTRDDSRGAWCAVFVNEALDRSGFIAPGGLLARSFLDYGEEVETPRALDLVVFWRKSKSSRYGHVGFYVGEDEDGIYVWGGNQGNTSNVTKYSKSRLLGYRRPLVSNQTSTNE
jgi:uncharacterized protein (TIGR02594 family)